MISKFGVKNKNSCHANPFVAHENPKTTSTGVTTAQVSNVLVTPLTM